MFSRFRLIGFAACLVFLIHCGGSTQNNTEESSASEQDLAAFVEWAGAAWNSLNLLLEAGDTLTFPLDCPEGGTMDQEGSQIVVTDCGVASDTATYQGTGTYAITDDGTLVTHAWDQDLTVAGGSFDGASFSSTGYINFDTSDGSVTYDFSATFASGLHRLAGTVTNNPDGTRDLTLSVSLDGIVWLDCTFDNADLDALTQEIIDAGCDTTSAGTTESCATLGCSNDFQCQLFADDDPSDEFTTANIECSEGCCAIVEEASACGANTVSCTNDFECQLFADDDTTDEFETGNTQCIDGCCALIE